MAIESLANQSDLLISADGTLMSGRLPMGRAGLKSS